MIATIPNELFNAIDIPSVGANSNADIRVTDFLKSISYRMPNCSDLTVEREFWNTVCDFAERCGSLRKKQDATGSAKVITVTDMCFQRFVGAGVGTTKTPISKISISEAVGGGYTLTNTDTATGTAYVIYSYVPDSNAVHDTTPVTQRGTTTYPNDEWVIPKWFAKTYQKLLIAGTEFRLHSMAGRPWSDFNAARSNAIVYNRELNRISHGLITSGMRKQSMLGMETSFVGNAQQAQTTTTTTETK